MKFDQIAIHDRENLPLKIMFNSLGAQNWIEDVVEAKGVMETGAELFAPIHNKAHLAFNYDLFGCEFELINYLEGDNFLRFINYGALSHIGIHVNSIENQREFMKIRGFKLIQEVITQSHSAPKVSPGRRYHYAIFRHNNVHMHFKLIERIIDEQVESETQKLLEMHL